MSEGAPSANDYVGMQQVNAICKSCDHWRQLETGEIEIRNLSPEAAKLFKVDRKYIVVKA